ncbi:MULTISPECIES: hypothetical protein [Blautia]|uniref:hypothetical protein n=1 Tax=Blautia TaxID=572511 RepID=UPI001FAE2D48|nr:hypothetical protein [Blautia sp. BIOML-A1]
MSRRRFLAIIMSVFMILSLLPATVFAETSKALDGQLKIQGLAAAGTVLSADLKGIKTEGVTEDSVSYEWFRKTPEDEKKEQQGEKPELKQLGKEKTYTIVKDDVDSKIVLTITGLEDKGFSGSLTATTATVTETVEAAEQNQTKTELNTEDMGENESQDANASEETSEETLEIPEAKEEDEAGSESVDGIPAATEDTETSQPEQYEQNTEEEPSLNEYQEELYPEEGNESSEEAENVENTEDTENAADNEQTSGDAGSSSVDGIPAATEDGTYGEGDTIPEDTDEKAYQAEAEVGDGSSDVLNFGNVVPGQEDELAQYITIKNTGTETLNFVGISPEHFAVQDITEPLEAGQSVQVWIAPRVGTQPGTYDDTITYQTEEGAEASFKAQMTITEEAPEDTPTPEPTQIPEDTPTPEPTQVPEDTPTPEPTQVPEDTPTPEPTQVPEDTPTPEPTQVPLESKVRSDMAEADFGSVVEGYTEAPQAKTATLTNEGNADAVLSDVFSDQGEIRYFDVSLSSQQISANGGTAAFSVRPKNNLSAGTYTESFTITDTTSGQNIVLTASVTVDTAKHSLGISTDTLDFASAKKGYSGIGGQQVTVTNNGNVTETLIQPTAKYFTVTASSALTIQPGETAVFTVIPISGLDVNSYQETIKISSEATETAFDAYFQVLKGTVSLTKIQNPSDISGIANGTAKDAQKLQLPSVVVIETTGGKAKAKVAWDVQNCSYKVSDTAAQSFTVKGAVTLPDGVDNDNKVELAAYVKVNVEAYTPKKASADDNKITGIEHNGVYTTQSKISFTAVGAGMDNSSPKKGDIRYIPLNWTVINTNTWDEAPYTACFGLAKSGDYRLKVVFQQQQYNGESWKNTDAQDAKQVAFSITKAKVTAPGTNVTPTANQKKSVRTNDATVILPFVIVLLIAVGAICGIIYYKKKKK